MENSILNRLGFDPAYLLAALFALCLILLAVTLICVFKLGSLRRKYEKFMKGRTAENLEELVHALNEDVKSLKAEDAANREAIRALNRTSVRSFQYRGLVKYNAFPGMGGESSFALALLDRDKNGYILNCIHSREGSYLYIKEVERGEGTVLLGVEEEKALRAAENSR